MNKHTPGPWAKDYYHQVAGREGRVIYVEDFTLSSCSTEEEAEANTQRIILCINACEGFSTEELEGANLFKDSIESQSEIIELKKRCDELLSILQRLEAVDFGEHWNKDAEQAAIAARAVIRKFEVENAK